MANGRVTKKTLNKKTEVKQEHLGSEASGGVDDLPDIGHDPFFKNLMDHDIGNGMFDGGLDFGEEEFFN